MTDYKPQGRSVETPRGHEGPDLNAVKITVTTTLLILFLVASHMGLKSMMRFFVRQQDARSPTVGTTPLAFGPQIPPGPHMQVDPREEREALEARQRQLLESYGWINERHTAAHIPIEEAKSALLRRGLPPAGARVPPPHAPLPEETRSGDVR
jgi:hypothetical protein